MSILGSTSLGAARLPAAALPLSHPAAALRGRTGAERLRAPGAGRGAWLGGVLAGYGREDV